MDAENKLKQIRDILHLQDAAAHPAFHDLDVYLYLDQPNLDNAKQVRRWYSKCREFWAEYRKAKGKK